MFSVHHTLSKNSFCFDLFNIVRKLLEDVWILNSAIIVYLYLEYDFSLIVLCYCGNIFLRLWKVEQEIQLDDLLPYYLKKKKVLLFNISFYSEALIATGNWYALSIIPCSVFSGPYYRGHPIFTQLSSAPLSQHHNTPILRLLTRTRHINRVLRLRYRVVCNYQVGAGSGS